MTGVCYGVLFCTLQEVIFNSKESTN